jgi:hypothetical protein
MPTNLSNIIRDLEQERTRIDRAIAALKSIGSTAAAKSSPAKAAPGRRRRRGHLSAAARARIAAAQKTRWAKFRAKKK